MVTIDINDYKEEKKCVYKGETYSVRDNGAVMRHPKENGRKRKNDDIWTFGKENNQNPYLLFAGTRVHRIVATAFLGNPPDEKYVVDHKDTNCRNNRPENLRWVTRLENALKNPVTRKKIEYLCGSIEAFLENPAIIRDKVTVPSMDWMRTVTKEEAENCRIRMELWSHRKTQGHSRMHIDYAKAFSNRVYKPIQKWEAGLGREPGLDFAKTPWCAQYMWDDLELPCCPRHFGDNPMKEYFNNIKQGSLFAFSEDNIFPKLYAYNKSVFNENHSCIVICKNEDGNWNVVGIEMNEKRFFIHFNLGTFSNLENAEVFKSSIKSESDFWRYGYSCRWIV